MHRESGKHLMDGIPKKEKGKQSRLTRQEKVLLAVVIVLAVALVVVVACQSLFVRPNLGNRPDTEQEQIDYGEGTAPRAEGERKSEDYYTVLILGRDTGGGGNTDTMLLASYDVTNQKATVMSIPRISNASTLFIIITVKERRAFSTSIRRLPSWWALSRTTRWWWNGMPWARSWTPWAACTLMCRGI